VSLLGPVPERRIIGRTREVLVGPKSKQDSARSMQGNQNASTQMIEQEYTAQNDRVQVKTWVKICIRVVQEHLGAL